MTRFGIYIGLCLFSLSSLSQSGYLGKLNSAELKIGVVPSIRVVNKFDGVVMSRKAKLINPNISISYARVIAKNFEVGAGYFYSNIQCSHDAYFFKGTPDINFYGSGIGAIIDEPKIAHQGGYIALNFYRLGCLAPIGKYIGFSFSYAITTVDTTDYFVVGSRSYDRITDGFFKSDYAVYERDSINLPAKKNISSNYLKMRIGRNYPLNDFLMLSVGMTVPIFSQYKTNNYDVFGFQVGHGSSYSINGDWTRYAAQAIKAYHRITFEASLRFTF